jgi:hypothetical protein
VLREVLHSLALAGADVIPLEGVRSSEQAARLIEAVATRAAQRRGPSAVLWRVNTGAARLPGKGGRDHVVRFGLPGQADIQGVIAPWGVVLQIEVKTDRRGSKQSPAQEAVERLITSAGGVYFVARSGAEARALYLDALARLEIAEAQRKARSAENAATRLEALDELMRRVGRLEELEAELAEVRRHLHPATEDGHG